MTMWRELIQELGEDVGFDPPASSLQVAEVEEALQVALPNDLKELLREANGVWALYGTALVWSTERIIKENLEYRTFPNFKELYMPFDPLLFFGDEGNGDLYAFLILAGKIRGSNIFLWDHETGSRRWYAFGLQRYLEMRIAADRGEPT